MKFIIRIMVLVTLVPAQLHAEEKWKNWDAGYSGAAPAGNDMENIASRFAFLSKKLERLPAPPKIENLEGIPAPPDMKNGEISFGEARDRTAL